MSTHEHGAPVDRGRPPPPPRGSGAATRRPPRRRPGTASASRTPAGRRRPSPGSRGSCRSGPRPRRSRWRRRRASAASGAYDADEDPHPLAAPLAVRAVGQRLGAAGGEQAAGVVGDRVVGALGPERAADRLGRVLRPARRAAARRRAGSGCSTTVPTATGRPASMSAATSPSSGNVSVRRRVSTKTSRMPPQVSPTANASSSLTP